MPRTARLAVERLEDRSNPVTFGNPWPDGSHITLSFVPDGTVMPNGAPSELYQDLSALGTDAAKRDILRAFQTWAVNSNINIGLIADGGQAFDAGGAIQGDPRFGDIRIGARPMGTDVLAITAPFNVFGTASGNVTLNSSYPHSIGGGVGYDLFTIFLQEAGHTLGVGNSTNLNSVMYEYYEGPRTSLAADDLASLQALYGTRQPDALEGSTGNDTLATAYSYTQPVDADITTAGDVDDYRFTVPAQADWTNIKLSVAGHSLLEGKVELLDAAGNVLASAAATDPLKNDLTISTSGLLPLTNYYVRVSGASGDVFGVGSYHLSIATHLQGGGVVGLNSSSGQFGHTLDTATPVNPAVTSTSGQYAYTESGSLSSADDADYFKIHSPSGSNSTVNMVAAVWSPSGGLLNARLAVVDSAGNAVPFKVLSSDGSNFVFQINNAVPNSDYSIEVSSSTGATGNYELAVDFRQKPVAFDLGSVGTLTDSTAASGATLTVGQSETIHFVLSAAGSSSDSAMTFSIWDSQNNLVFRLSSNAGDARSADFYLAAGTYSVQVRAYSRSGQIFGSQVYTLDAAIITDPIGVQAVDPTNNPDGDPTGSGGSGSSPPPTSWAGLVPSDGCQWF